MNKAIFLDRDGVICEDTDYVTSLDKLHIFDFSCEAIEIMHKKGYKVIVVTNQSAVARGMFNEQKLKVINDFLIDKTKVDKIYYCPHLPPLSGEKEKLPYIINCICRKPNNGMILKGIEEFNVDVKLSYMVGDRLTDIEAGKKSGLKTVFVKSGVAKLDRSEYDLCFENIKEFAEQL